MTEDNGQVKEAVSVGNLYVGNLEESNRGF